MEQTEINQVLDGLSVQFCTNRVVTPAWSRHLRRLCSPAESGVVGNRQGETEKIDEIARRYN
jgi:hypothetical protein